MSLRAQNIQLRDLPSDFLPNLHLLIVNSLVLFFTLIVLFHLIIYVLKSRGDTPWRVDWQTIGSMVFWTKMLYMTVIELCVELLSVTGEDSSIALSTLRMTGGGAHGRLSGRLAHMLRVAGHPIVGDRFARRERVALPRACGPLKAKLQIGCYGVAADGVEPPLGVVDVAEDPPERLSAAHWERVVAEAERKSRPGST